MDFGKVSKAIAGGIFASAGATTTIAAVVPPEVILPWYGYVIIAVCNAALGFIGVYYAPKNAQ